MDIKTFAQNYFELVSASKFEECLKLKSNDIVSIEAAPSDFQTCKGMDTVLKKNQWWEENHEVHALNTIGPFCNENQFSIIFEMDSTFKPTGARDKMTEVALYTVENSKIIEERFFYDY